MFYVLRDTGFSYGDVVFRPEQPNYFGFASRKSPENLLHVDLTIRSSRTRKLPHFVRANRASFFSGNIVEIFHGVEGVEFYPASVFVRGERYVKDVYCMAHISESINCIDLDLAEISGSLCRDLNGDFDFTGVDSIEKIKIDDKIVGGRDIFYIRNSPFPFLPVVSEAFAKRIISIQPFGVQLVRVDEFSYR